MSNQHLDFYFDFLSPYAFFAWRKIRVFCRDYELELRIHPVVFGKLLDHWGQLGPAEIPPKREWLTKYCQRYAQQHGFTLAGPKYHPFNPLPALRVSLKDVAGMNQEKIVNAIFEAGWIEGRDLGDSEELLAVLNGLELDGFNLIGQTRQSAIKARLKEETAAAIARGVFGVPTMILQGELFWGNDQFDHMALLAEGKDDLDSQKITERLNRERAIDRKRIST